MPEYRHTTVKLYKDQFDTLVELSRAYNKSVSAVLRALLSFAIDSLSDPALKKRVEEYIEKEFGIRTKPVILDKRQKLILF